jgi:hypothetical protein
MMSETMQAATASSGCHAAPSALGRTLAAVWSEWIKLRSLRNWASATASKPPSPPTTRDWFDLADTNPPLPRSWALRQPRERFCAHDDGRLISLVPWQIGRPPGTTSRART